MLFVAACTHAPASPLPEASSLSPAEALATARARRPERFKMVHQVSASYAGQSYVMTGYMLGRKDGAFRVSSSSAIGPQLFDVAKLNGVFQKDVHFAPLAQKLDAIHIAQAIDRIFMADCTEDGRREANVYVYRCPVSGDDEADTLEVSYDARTLSPVKKVFSLASAAKVTITYEEPRRFGEEWIPMREHLKDAYGYSLDIAVSEYVPGFAFSDDVLRLSR